MTYRERLWPTPWLFVAGLLLIPAVILMLAPISLPLAIPSSLIAYGLLCLFLVATSPMIEVQDGELRAGRARISRNLLGSVERLDPEQTRVALSTGSDARAYLVIRSWIPESLKISVTDSTDPTPYWLVSTRNPEGLRNALK